MVVLGKFVNMIYSFDDVALDEFLILFSHADQISLYFTQNSLELAIYFRYLAIYLHVLSLQFVDPFSQTIVPPHFDVLQFFSIGFDSGHVT